MEQLLSTITTVGATTLPAFWLPVLVWTLFASIVLVFSNRVKGSYRTMYSISQALLLSLPAGVIAAQFINPLTWMLQTAAGGPVLAVGYVMEGVLSAPVAGNEGSAAYLSNPGFYAGLLAISVIPFSVIRLIRLGNSYRKLVRMRKIFVPVTEQCGQGRLRYLMEKLHIRLPVALLQSSGYLIPFTFGVIRPVIVIPEGTEKSDLDHILLHELAHVRRFDNLVLIVEQLIRSFFIFHPLVHHLARKSGHYREICCDADVLIAQTSMDTGAYARTLLKYLQPEYPLDLTAGMAKPSNIKERILIMQKFGNTIPAGSKIAGKLAGLAIICTFTLLMACTDSVNLLSDNASQTIDTAEFTGIPTDDLVAELNKQRDRLSEIVQDRRAQIQSGSYNSENLGDDPDILSVMARVNAIHRVLRDRDDLPEDLRAHFARVEEMGQGPEVFSVVEIMPQMIGGIESFYNALKYPEMARRAGIEGRVIVQYVIDEDGNVQNPRILRGIGGGTDEAVLEALQHIRFTPGLQRGRAVKVQMTQPVVFRLSNQNE